MAIVSTAAALVPRPQLEAAKRRVRAWLHAARQVARQRPPLVSGITIALGLVPAIFFAVWIGRYAVAVPKMDDWDVAQLISKAHRGQVTVGDLFEQQQEGRTLVPRLFFLLSTVRGGWDVRDLMWMTVPTTWLTAAGVFTLLRRSEISALAGALVFGAATALIFTPAQYEVMTFAFGFPSFLPALFIVAGLVVVGSRFSVSAKFAACAALSLASSFTLPNGLLAWGLTFPVLFLQQRITRWPRWLGGWLVASAICAAIYFSGYHKPDYLPEFAPHVQVGDYSRYFVAFLGNAMQNATKSHLVAAEVFGVLSLTIFSFSGAYIVGWKRAALARSAPWLALGCYALGNAGLAALGRIGYGVSYALSSRYVTFSLYLPLAALALVAIVIAESANQLQATGVRVALFASVTLALIAGFFFQARCAADDLYFLAAHTAKERVGRAGVQFASVVNTARAIERTIYPPGAGRIRELATMLDAQGLLRPPLVHSASLADLRHRQADGKRASGGWEKTIGKSGGLVEASGWAVFNAKDRPA
ncbi:MAG: hypothetical protein M3Z64_07270, partial [Verrucomicrobiota bacterium]|nr:hypothetical protein [Verrucomicrobiota bacterium]